jgi:hypothetical protein
MNVLSLFDGMSCGRLALAKAGIAGHSVEKGEDIQTEASYFESVIS